MAREVLLLLAQDPANEAMLKDALIRSDKKTFGVDPVTAAVVITGALVVLQTEVNIDRDKKGRWSFSVKKKSASDGLLKEVVGKLGGLMSKK